jgi:hypothetical protein
MLIKLSGCAKSPALGGWRQIQEVLLLICLIAFQVAAVNDVRQPSLF